MVNGYTTLKISNCIKCWYFMDVFELMSLYQYRLIYIMQVFSTKILLQTVYLVIRQKLGLLSCVK